MTHVNPRGFSKLSNETDIASESYYIININTRYPHRVVSIINGLVGTLKPVSPHDLHAKIPWFPVTHFPALWPRPAWPEGSEGKSAAEIYRERRPAWLSGRFSSKRRLKLVRYSCSFMVIKLLTYG